MAPVGIQTLYDAARHALVFDCRKHDLAPDAEAFATEKINAMTNDELLQQISWHLPEVLRQAQVEGFES